MFLNPINTIYYWVVGIGGKMSPSQAANTVLTLAPAHFLLYPFLGGSIKYIDDAFDIGRSSRLLAYPLALLSGLLMGLLMTLDPMSATIFSAIILAAIVSAKVDNGAFTLGLLATMAVVGLRRTLVILPVQFGLLSFAAILDEIGSNKAKMMTSSSPLVTFFRFRMSLKAVAIILFATGAMGLSHLLAVLSFDFAYHLVDGRGAIWS